MARNNREYWIARAIEREHEAYLRGAGLSLKMFMEYETAAGAISREVERYYSRYAGQYGLTYEQAVQVLNQREFQEWTASLGDYVSRIARETDPRVKALLTAQLDALSYNSSITRLEALNGQIDMILNDLYTKGVAQMKAEFGDLFTESYYKKSFALQARAGFVNQVAKINAGMIENIVSYPWSGAMFSDRLWQNKQNLVFQLREITTQASVQGKGIAAMSKELSARTGQSYKVAERLIRTETNHLHNEAEKTAYKAAGVKEYEFCATLDKDTCPTCGALDGKHFPLDKAKPGDNFPPIHPNDRCTTIEYDPLDEQDWAVSGYPMPPNMTWEEWAASQGVSSEAVARWQ